MSTHCPECGNHFLSSDASEAQARISDLETQVRLLNSKAASYIEKIADYESHIRSLQAECTKLLKERDQTISATPLSPPQAQSQKDGLLQIPPPTPEKDSVPQKIAKRPSLSRLSTLSSYLPMRKSHDVPEVPPIPPIHSAASQSTPVLATPSPEWMRSLSLPPSAIDPGRYPQSVTLIGLQTSLETERQLRQQAESSLAQSQSELEELTAQLFGQANEMVATERKARAKLEERVKLLETRDGEKRRRLDRLEKAVDRIERVRRMVVAHEKEMGDDAYIQTEIVQSQGQNRKIMRHMQQPRSRRRNGHNNKENTRNRPEVVSEDENEDDDRRISTLEDYGDYDSRTYEFDVQLKVWRRSRANMWRTPTFS